MFLLNLLDLLKMMVKRKREAKLYITPDLIGDNQPDFHDEITLTFAGSTRVAKIVNIDTKKGGQDLFIYYYY